MSQCDEEALPTGTKHLFSSVWDVYAGAWSVCICRTHVATALAAASGLCACRPPSGGRPLPPLAQSGGRTGARCVRPSGPSRG